MGLSKEQLKNIAKIVIKDMEKGNLSLLPLLEKMDKELGYIIDFSTVDSTENIIKGIVGELIIRRRLEAMGFRVFKTVFQLWEHKEVGKCELILNELMMETLKEDFPKKAQLIKRLIAFEGLSGFPDYIGIKNQDVIGIEVKVNTSKPSSKQHSKKTGFNLPYKELGEEGILCLIARVQLEDDLLSGFKVQDISYELYSENFLPKRVRKQIRENWAELIDENKKKL